MKFIDNKNKSVRNLLQDIIYKHNIKHYVEPFARSLKIANQIHCENKIAIFKRKEQDSGNVLIANCHYYEIVPPISKCLFYCNTSNLLQHEILDFMQWVYIISHKGHIVVINTPTNQSLDNTNVVIKNKTNKILIYGGENV